MKHWILSLALATPLISAAQTPQTVQMGAGYAQDVWVHLENGTVQSAPATEWDVAFAVSAGASSSIHINAAAGVELWVYPSGDTSAWNSFDTMGQAQWSPTYNSPEFWSGGAFDMTATNDPTDLGWGTYSFITHHVTGDSLYLIKLANGTYRKLWIERLAGGAYEFKYANLDGSNEQQTSVNKGNYAAKMFAYYSLVDNQVYDREPSSDTWHVKFTRYIDYISTPAPTPYLVSGVWTHPDMETAEIYPVDVMNYSDTAVAYSSDRNIIGYDWKSFQGSWQLKDSLVYLVREPDGDVYKLWFTDFGGSATGEVQFNVEKIDGATHVSETAAGSETWSMYPNPVASGQPLQLAAPASWTGTTTITLVDLTGSIRYQTVQDVRQGLFEIPTSGLAAGMYLMQVSGAQGEELQKVIIQ